MKLPQLVVEPVRHVWRQVASVCSTGPILAEQVIQTLMKKQQGTPAMGEDEADVRAADQAAVDDQAHDSPRRVELILEGRFVNTGYPTGRSALAPDIEIVEP